ncbi:MAG: archaetidylserine decarboxylase [Alphaproteobacteria bacterium]|nr:archaetidylserine decarboxylase [Alphaproteobacteria bacterium]
MTLRTEMMRIFAQEDINFLLTNRIPRRLLTSFVGWFSQIEQPLIRNISIKLWSFFSDLDLSEAKQTKFCSMHACFTRELKEGARPVDIDPAVLTSPCDAIVGAGGMIAGNQLLQVKGFPYTLQELLGTSLPTVDHVNGCYVTLRLTSSMYHRFHAPHDCRVEQVNYISGDTWNVNPIALKRIEKLFCKNERAVIRTRTSVGGHNLTLVPVAAILVASIRLHFIDVLLNIKHRGPNVIPCDASFRKGDEMGWFEHGSTIIVLAPRGFSLCGNVREGATIRMGQPLMRLP